MRFLLYAYLPEHYKTAQDPRAKFRGKIWVGWEMVWSLIHLTFRLKKERLAFAS